MLYGPRMRGALLSLAVAVWFAGCADEAPSLGESVVGVRAFGCEAIERIGSGVVVESEGGPVVVTSAHTVSGASEVVVFSDEESPVELLGFDPAADLAVFTAPADATAAPLAEAIDVGQHGRLIIWEPDDTFVETKVEVTRRLRVTIEDIFVEGAVERLAFEIDAAIVRGDSGAPIFDRDGAVLGIIYARARERDAAFAVRYEEIASLIAQPTIPAAATRCR